MSDKSFYPELFHFFVRTTPIREDEWINILQERVSVIDRLSRFATFKTLGNMKPVFDSSELASCNVKIDEIATYPSLDIQGIFETSRKSYTTISNSGFQPGYGGSKCEDGYIYVWGLTRNMCWILAKVEWRGESGHKNCGYRRITSITITPSSAEEIILTTKVSYENIWNRLGDEILVWSKNLDERAARVRQEALKVTSVGIVLQSAQDNAQPQDITWFCDRCQRKGRIIRGSNLQRFDIDSQVKNFHPGSMIQFCNIETFPTHIIPQEILEKIKGYVDQGVNTATEE